MNDCLQSFYFSTLKKSRISLMPMIYIFRHSRQYKEKFYFYRLGAYDFSFLIYKIKTVWGEAQFCRPLRVRERTMPLRNSTM